MWESIGELTLLVLWVGILYQMVNHNDRPE